MPEYRTNACSFNPIVKRAYPGILQPPEVIQDEKWGELRGALKGNPEPSLTNDVKVVKKVQRLRVRNQTNKLYKRPTS